ncbi:unnamed protein product [Protopolystoma xenopodis]|uniref:Uncharacterized protein n=1 Tax=Protopolystoma xenopodis TaxID=117903 RepID=A0A3S5ADA2_9PLAT|nr:unnamed protein product [Protopolystoma xenopodis]
MTTSSDTPPYCLWRRGSLFSIITVADSVLLARSCPRRLLGVVTSLCASSPMFLLYESQFHIHSVSTLRLFHLTSLLITLHGFLFTLSPLRTNKKPSVDTLRSPVLYNTLKNIGP